MPLLASSNYTLKDWDTLIDHAVTLQLSRQLDDCLIEVGECSIRVFHASSVLFYTAHTFT